jgi:hypothetical protein
MAGLRLGAVERVEMLAVAGQFRLAEPPLTYQKNRHRNRLKQGKQPKSAITS